MKSCLSVRIIVLFALIGSVGLWLTGAEAKATWAKQSFVKPATLSVRNIFSRAPGAESHAPWSAFFDYRKPVWSFTPNAAAIPFASITVTTTADAIDAAGNCAAVTLASLPGPGGQTSLREAICAANNNAGADTITFSVNGTFALTGAANDDNGNSGDFDIKQSLTINGNGAANTILDGSGIERIFDVFPSAATTFDLSNLTIQNGDTRLTSFQLGGAIYLHNNVTSTFNSIQVINNFSGANGAIDNVGNLTINNSVISNNQTIPTSGSTVGGGIRNGGTLTIDNTTISNNTVRGEGGGITINSGAVVVVNITNSTISGNTASITGGGLGNGGGVSTTGNQGTINLTNCTISGNRADANGGGAAFVSVNGGAVTLTNVTITNNTADNDNNSSGAGGGFSQGSTTTVTLRNTIVAGNFNSTAATRDDISGAVVNTSSYNLIGDGTGSSGISNGANNNQVGSGASPINPLLGSLTNNGGSTQTHALLTGSPAINTANNATSPATDQRGIARPVGGVSDIGSFELADITPPDTTITSNPSNPSSSSTATFTFTGSDSGGSGLAGFQCQIDGGGFSACTSPQTYLGLADGSRTFQVRAIDGAGNVDPTPASFTWTIISSMPPTVSKAFGVASVPLNGTTSLTFTITNPNAGIGLTGVSFTDTLPSGLVVATPNGLSGMCNGTVTAVAGSNTISLSGGSLTGGGSCMIAVNVTGTSAGAKNNSVAASASGIGTGPTSSTVTLNVFAPPTVSKFFVNPNQGNTNNTSLNGTARLAIAITNPPGNPGSLNGLAITDTFPAGLEVDSPVVSSNTCGGSFSPSAGATSISLSGGGPLTVANQCTIFVVVKATTAGAITNTTGNVSSTEGGTGGTASGTLNVYAPPTIAKAFGAGTIAPNTPTTMSFTITNPAGNPGNLTGVAFSDTLLNGLQIAGTPNLSTANCGSPTTTGFTSGSTSLMVSGTTVTTANQCVITVNVVGTMAGTVNNTTTAVTSTQGGTGATSNTATLVVGSAPAVTKSFSPAAIKTGATSTMTISITNNNPSLPFNGVDYTDTLPAGLTVPDAAAAPACGGTLTVASNVITLTGATIAAGGGNCTTTFTVTGATPGVKDNTVTVNTTNFGTGFTGTGTITVYDVPTITKGFSPTSVAFGGTSTMSFVLTNPNSFAGGNLSGLSFTDTLTAGITVGSGTTSVCGGTLTTTAPSTVSFSGGTLGTSGPGNTCTINVTVTGAAIGMWQNTVTVLTSTETGANGVNASATLTVTASPTTTTITNAATLASTPTVVGQSYAVSVAVAPSMGGMGIPTGTVNVSDGTGATCTITLSGGSGTCNLTSTTAGAKTITASYLGDTNFATSSVTATHTVNKADTTLSNLTDSPDPSVVGQAYTVGFTLSVNSPGAGTPTGTVTVSDGAGGICTATLPATSCSLTSTTAGNKTLTFTYNGDANFNASTATAGHAVNKADTTVAITADTPDPSVIGQNYAVTASVSVTSPGGGTPTGTITVTDGTNNCTITLPAASCNLPSASVGMKTLTATYSGDSNYNGSGPSAGVPHTVNKADVTVSITSDNPDPSAVGQNVTVAFTVAAAPPGAGTPSGNITITVSGGSETCTGSLVAGSGSCTLVLTVPGSRILTATYNGDANFNGGTDTEPHTVVAPPSISKAFSPASVPVGQASTLTFTITNPAANTVALTGVGFSDAFPNAPNLIVASPTGATLTGCGGATLTDNLGGALAPGDLGVMLSGATVGVGGTCTVTVNVTPQAQGPFNNVSGNVSSTNGGTGNTASATLLTNTPPTISSNNVPVPAGSNAASFTIATAVDPDQPVNTLDITINGNPATASSNGVTVSNVTITPSGAVTANIATTCAATTATFNLVVTDNQNATGTGTLTVTVTPNTPPVLTYNATTVTAGTTPTIPSATGPSDNGTFTIGSVSVSPNNGGLGVLLNQSNGVVTILNALLIGSYTVTVPITDNCGATNNAQLIITVVCPTITLNPASLPNATVNTAYSQTLSASPAGGNYSFTVTSGSLPAGLTLNSNGSFSGAPTVSGTFNFRVTTTGFGGCTAFRDYTLVVVCPAITVNPASLPGGSVGTSYSQTMAGSPAGTYSYSVTSGVLPAGLTLNASTGAITGTPTTTGSFNFTITATAGACSGSRAYTIAIACPAITLSPASPLPSGPAGVAYSQTISASPAGGYTFSLVSGSLPSGLTLNPGTGVISGLPSTVGSFTFTIKAQTASGCNAAQSYTLAIVCPAVTLIPASLPGGSTSVAYNQTISATPAGGGYSYAVTTGTLPAGLNLNSATGVLSGTPAAAGSFTFRVTATGFGGCTGFRDYTIVIGGGGCPTITLPASLPNGSVGQLYNAAATASPSGSYNYTAAGSLPPGVTLYNSNGLIFGYPTAAGSYTFTITATAGACSGSQTYTVLIGAGFAASLTVFSDFDGDGKSDLSVWRGSDGNWLVVNSGDGQVRTTSWGASYAPYNDVTVSGDYDGDGKTDLAVFRRGGAQAGYWYIKQSSDGQVKSHFWGLGTDVPVPGDYDGDGKTDVAVWRGSAGAWYILRSSDGGIEARTWGYAPVGDVPVPGDYDGDSKTDLAVFRRSTGFWYIRRSSDAVTISTEWGVGTDVPVPGDYDGDGKTDLAVWRGSEGAWHIIESGSAVTRTVSLGDGRQGDLPVGADYDGDGKADPAIWRASTGTWSIKRSSDSVEITKAHGQSGDAPVMARRN